MTRRRKKGSSYTPPAEQRHWYPRKQAGRQPGRVAASPRPPRRRAETAGNSPAPVRRPGPIPAEDEMVTGRNAALEALRARAPATALYVARGLDMDARVREALGIAADAGVPVLEASRGELDRLAGGDTHQGLALQVPPYPYVHPDDLVCRARDAGEVPLVVALDGVTDPRNLGAVARSAAAFGCHGLVVPRRRAAGVTAAAWKASAGALARIPVARAANLTRTLRDYQQAGLFVVGLAASAEGTVDAIEVSAEPVVVVVGAEGRGLSRLVADVCDELVRIPMAGGAESLNAAVAAGIALYQVARVRSGRPPG